MDEITLTPSTPRRIMAVGSLGMVGVLCLGMSTRASDSDLARVALAVIGAAALLGSWHFWNASATSLVLRDGALRTSDGEVITTVDNIASIDRGTFAFKPSSGFLIRTHTPAARRWVPGLWWRMGRRIGIGGVFPASPAKLMAETLALGLPKG